MRVLVAPDGFKGSLRADEVAAAITAGWRYGAPRDKLEVLPLSDGGSGFVDVLAGSTSGRKIAATARDPFGRPVRAEVLLDGDTAYVEAAQTCGLDLVGPAERRPELESTAGVADLIAAATAAGARRVIVGVGGSATNDGGAGLLEASGVGLRDRSGGIVAAIPARLADVDHVELQDGWRPSAELVAACDVDNPLLGPEGATAVYGTQKGVRPCDIRALDATLAHLVAVLGRDVPDAAGLERSAGAGAGGGIGYGLSVLGASRQRGIDLVLEATHFGELIARADVVVTGEGSFDDQSFRGKVVAGVAAIARARGIPCIVLAGRVAVPATAVDGHGLAVAYSVSEQAGSEAASLAEPARHLTALATRVARLAGSS